MSKIMVLDCTLRDGGYVNDYNFGKDNIKKIINYLNLANIDIIECGYLFDNIEDDKDKTKYNTFKQAEKNITKHNNYTVMLSGMKYKIDTLPKRKKGYIDTIRLAFHKKDLKKVEEYSKRITENGYKIFIQPQVIMTYTDEEIIDMLKMVNQLDVECVSIVDTFGQMIPKDIKEKTLLFDKYLRKNIKIGLHLHNNLQTAFTNAMTFLDTIPEDRDVVIDTSILGMGRGAGNLPTELLANYLNSNYQKKYNIEAILKVSDNIISKIKKEYNWGYSLPYYLSAIKGIHPSYIIYFLEKGVTNSIDINKLIEMISNNKKEIYDKEYADKIYDIYKNNKIGEKNENSSISSNEIK